MTARFQLSTDCFKAMSEVQHVLFIPVLLVCVHLYILHVQGKGKNLKKASQGGREGRSEREMEGGWVGCNSIVSIVFATESSIETSCTNGKYSVWTS